MSQAFDWTEVPGDKEVEFGSSSEFYKFVSAGDVKVGVLKGKRVRDSNFTDDKGNRRQETLFDFTGLEGGAFTISAPYDLKAKLEKVQIGKVVEMTYKDDKPLKDGRSMKLFTVRVGTPRTSPSVPF